MIDNTYGMQTRQSGIDLQVSVAGFSHWHEPFQKICKLGRFGIKHLGKESATLMEACECDASVNGLTQEASMLATLINQGYVLEELTISFTNPKEVAWGRAFWCKQHSSYADPKNWLREYGDISDEEMSLFSAMFMTEHAGEQFFGLISSSVFGSLLIGMDPKTIGFVFNKSILFHRVAFSEIPTATNMAA